MVTGNFNAFSAEFWAGGPPKGLSVLESSRTKAAFNLLVLRPRVCFLLTCCLLASSCWAPRRETRELSAGEMSPIVAERGLRMQEGGLLQPGLWETSCWVQTPSLWPM